MTHQFPDDVVAAVLRHMNADHVDDSALIARAFWDPDAVSAVMTGFNGDGGDWDVVSPDGTVHPVRIAWPGGSIAERPAVRREVVALYDDACARLGIEPRPH
ncbi:DUF2470 domain-containing protein [Microbacterium halotolerans]|uniref:DUF2470 domain-containing protein n=1 Tax=Microbacterium halotolerans TaxID=246613 RepID=UPI000E6AD01C|nr:DUF2470 domain-containing protein [Microbacterium halotolerans]